jgi:hypothetical protein
MAVKGAPLSSAFIEAKRRPLTATAAEATRRQPRRDAGPAPALYFQHVYARATKVTAPVTASRQVCIELPDSTRVDARKHVNASLCAVAARIPLALLTLTAEEP